MIGNRTHPGEPARIGPHDVGDAYLHLESHLLALLHGTSMAIAQLQEPAAIGQCIVEITELFMPVDSRFLIGVYLNDSGPRILAHSKHGHDGEVLTAGDAARIERTLRADLTRGVIAGAMRTGKTVRCGDVRKRADFVDVFGTVRSCLCVPAVAGNRVVGAINVESTFADVFDEREQTALEIVANQLAVALENARLLEEARSEISRRRAAETRMSTLNQQLSRLAIHDELTGLVNRREFQVRLTRALETARKVGGVHALCLFDLDRFKFINDFGGHAAGDALLENLTASLRTVVRKRDTLARLGGDEFALLMEHCSIGQALRVAEKLRKATADFSMRWQDRALGTSCSIGLATIDARSASIEQVLRDADAACYAAKHAGGDRIQTADSAAVVIQRRDRDNRALATFEAALATPDGVWLEGQPIVELRETANEVQRVEVLARLRMPDSSELFPKDFMGAVERFHLAPALDRRVLELVIRWLAGDPHIDGRRVAAQVNLSGQSLGDAALIEFIDRQIMTGRLNPARIGFEITETAAIGDLPTALRAIECLRARGCEFAIDDFGTGLASIGYLRDLDVDWVKVDGVFVRGLAGNPQGQTLVGLMNDVAHGFDLRTVAECVENADDLDVVRALGVDAVQGYYTGGLFRIALSGTLP